MTNPSSPLRQPPLDLAIQAGSLPQREGVDRRGDDRIGAEAGFPPPRPMRPGWRTAPGDALAAVAAVVAVVDGLGSPLPSGSPPSSREQHDDENGRQHAKQDDADDRRPGRRLSAGSNRRLRLERGIRLIGHVFPPTCDVAGHSSVPKEPRDPLMQSLDPRTPPGQELRYGDQRRRQAPFSTNLPGARPVIHRRSTCPRPASQPIRRNGKQVVQSSSTGEAEGQRGDDSAARRMLPRTSAVEGVGTGADASHVRRGRRSRAGPWRRSCPPLPRSNSW